MHGTEGPNVSAGAENVAGFSPDSLYRSALGKHRRGDLGGAEKEYRLFIASCPDHVDALSNLGGILLVKSDLDGAGRMFAEALQRQPNHLQTLEYLRILRFRQGNHFFEREDFDRSNRAFHEAASLPGGKELWRWKSLGFCPSVFTNENSVERYRQRLNAGLDLALESKISVDWQTLPRDGFTPSFNLPHLGRCCREIKEKFARLFENVFPFNRPTLADTMRGRKRIRIGFVVTSGHQHGFLRVHRHLMQSLDPKKFEVFFIGNESLIGPCRKVVKRNDISWIGFSGSFPDIVNSIREARCDVLYFWKVGGGPLDYFLPMAKLAPFQCTSYGTHGTGGVKAVDYYLTSSLLETKSSGSHYTEQAVYFDSYVTSHECRPVPPGNRQEFGLPSTGAIYLCPHRIGKYHPMFDRYLKRILEADPRGIVVLLVGKREKTAASLSDRLRLNLGDTLYARVKAFPALSPRSYKKLVGAASCVLDCPTYVGDLTTHDAFEQDVPAVTQEGELLVQRYTAGLYRMMEMESVIAKDEDEYVETAVRFGTDRDFLDDVRDNISQRKETVFSPRSNTSDYERFFESLV